ncbi:MAG: hypothetical protein AAF741_06380 [Bacteroidota bacterium]
MQVPKIKSYLASYKDWQLSETGLSYRSYWETQANWQQHFNLESIDLAHAYDRALTSQTSRRHYSRRAFEPKAVMIDILRREPELARATFEDLLREGHTLDGRLSRFGVYMDELFSRYRESVQGQQVYGDHFHGADHQMPTIYLAMQYPDRYVPYDTDTLMAVCKKLGARAQPLGADPVRFMKLAKLLDRFVREDERLMRQYQNEFLRGEDYQQETLLLAWHLMQFIRIEELV